MDTKTTFFKKAFLAFLLGVSGCCQAALFGSSNEEGAKDSLWSFAESLLGVKTLVEGTKVVEKALNRDLEVQLRELNEKLRKIRIEKNDATKKAESQRKAVIAAASKVRPGEGPSEGRGLPDDVAKRLHTIYEERLQSINALLGIWTAIPGVLEDHIAALQGQVSDVAYDGIDLASKTIYSMDEYQYVETQIQEVDEQIKRGLSARDAFNKERDSLLGRIAYLKRELDTKRKEEASLRTKKDDGTGKGNRVHSADASEDRSELHLDDKLRVLREEENLMEDRIALTSLKVRKLELEQALGEDELSALKARFARLNTLFTRVKRAIVIEEEDVNRARDAKIKQDTLLAEERVSISAATHEKTIERERVREQLESLKAAMSALKASGKEEPYEAVALQAREWLYKNRIKALDAQIALLGLDNDYIDAETRSKTIQFESVNIRYSLVREDAHIGSWLDDIISKKKIDDDQNKKYKAQQRDAQKNMPSMHEELERLKKKQQEYSDPACAVFVGHEDTLKGVLQCIVEARDAIRLQIAQTQKFVTRVDEITKLYERLERQCGTMMAELEAHRVNINIWRRSERGISIMMLLEALDDAQAFSKNLFWKTHDIFDAHSFVRNISFSGFLGMLLFALMYWLGFLIARGLLSLIRRRVQLFTSYQKGNFVFWYLNVVLLVFDAVQRQFAFVYGICFVYLQIKLKASYYGFFSFANSDYALAVFYLAAMVIWSYVCSDFLSELRVLNVRLSYFFFSERNQRRILSLVSLLLHATAAVFPLRSALLVYGARYESLPSVLFAGYSLIVIVAFAFLFDKDDLLSLIPGRGEHWLAVRGFVDTYFYPSFLFVVLLFVLANPYVGYSQLAWYLAFFVPTSIFVMIFSAWVYGSLRKHVLWIFIDERDDERAERFDYARVYYAFFITLSFLALLFLMVGLLSQIWGLPYNLSRLWTAVSEEWVLPIKENKFGFIEFIYLYTAVVGGYLASTLANKFILSKVFEVFGAEPGAQNTFSRILHVLVLLVAFAFGCAFIGFKDLIPPMGLALALVGFFGSKDLLTDFVAGLLILLERQIEIGHYISTEGQRGTVYKISARSTIIRTAQNYFVVIPNRNLISNSIINWGAGRYSVGFELTINVAFENDPDVVLDVLRKVLNAHPLILRVPAVVIRLENFTPQGADFFVRAYVSIRKVKEQWDIASDVRIAIYKAFREKGIVFPYPRLIMYNSPNQPDDANTFFKFKFDDDAGHQQMD